MFAGGLGPDVPEPDVRHGRFRELRDRTRRPVAAGLSAAGRTASGQACAFAAILAHLTARTFTQWISDVQAAGLADLSSFANGSNRTSAPSPRA